MDFSETAQGHEGNLDSIAYRCERSICKVQHDLPVPSGDSVLLAALGVSDPSAYARKVKHFRERPIRKRLRIANPAQDIFSSLFPFFITG